jgi:hypothetical protein
LARAAAKGRRPATGKLRSLKRMVPIRQNHGECVR